MADKLDYTIELDGTEYDLTAADSLHADLANRVENKLTINESKLDSSVAITDTTVIDEDVQELNSIEFNGSAAKAVSVVPSNGGVFTGPIYIPDISAPNEDLDNNISANKKAAINLNSLETLISALKGFPILNWDGTELKEDGDADGAIEPFKVVLYPNSAENSINDIPSKYYFLLVNKDTGYLRLGYPTDSGSDYTDLGVYYAKYTSQLGAATGTDGTDYYTFSKLQELITDLQEADETEASTRSTKDAELEEKIDDNTTNISTNTTNIATINNTLGTLTNIYGYAGTGAGSATRKNIFHGSDGPASTLGNLGDIYIKTSN